MNFGLKYPFFFLELELCRKMLLIFLSAVWLTLNVNSLFWLVFINIGKEQIHVEHPLASRMGSDRNYPKFQDSNSDYNEGRLFKVLVYIKEKLQKLSCRKLSAYFGFMTRNLYRRIISGCENQEFLSALRTAFDHLLLGPFVSQVILSENRDVNFPLAAWFRDQKWNKIMWHPNKWMEARLFKLGVPTCASSNLSCLLVRICLSYFLPVTIHMVLKDFCFLVMR